VVYGTPHVMDKYQIFQSAKEADRERRRMIKGISFNGTFIRRDERNKVTAIITNQLGEFLFI